MRKWICWFFSSNSKQIVEDPTAVYDKLIELEGRISKLEEENIETTNSLYQLSNSIEAVDQRIDIVAENSHRGDSHV